MQFNAMQYDALWFDTNIQTTLSLDYHAHIFFPYETKSAKEWITYEIIYNCALKTVSFY